MSDIDCRERIALLEAHHEETLRYRDTREKQDHEHQSREEAQIDSIHSQIEEINDSLSEVTEYLSHQKGFIGGIVFICGAVATVITVFANRIFG